MSEPGRHFGKWLLPTGLIVLVAGLVTVALVRGPVELSPDTPEGTVQQYLIAIDEQRWDDAVALIHPDSLGSCDGSDLAVQAPGEFTAELGTRPGFDGGVREGDFTVTAEPIDGAGEESPLPPQSDTTVDVTINHGDGGFGSGWNEFVTFELADDGEFWWIVDHPWPYFDWDCGGR